MGICILLYHFQFVSSGHVLWNSVHHYKSLGSHFFLLLFDDDGLPLFLTLFLLIQYLII